MHNSVQSAVVQSSVKLVTEGSTSQSFHNCSRSPTTHHAESPSQQRTHLLSPAFFSQENLSEAAEASSRDAPRGAAEPAEEREGEGEAAYEEGRERQRQPDQAGVSGSEDSTAPGNGVGRANLFSFSVRQNLLILGGGGKGKGGEKGKGDGKEKGDKLIKLDGKGTTGDGKGDKGSGGDYVQGIGEQKTLKERTREKTVRNREAILKAKATMKARGEERGLDLDEWSIEQQQQWVEYTKARNAYLLAREAEKPTFPLERYADPNETLEKKRVRDPAAPNPATYQSENGILSEEEVKRLQPIAKPPPDAVIHKVGRPYKGEWGINVNSAGWAPGNPDAPDTGSHRGELNKYGKVATAFPYGTWIGERWESTFEAAPMTNNSPYWSLNYRPTVSQSVTITHHKNSNHVKGGERTTSSLAGLCNPANKLPPKDGLLEVHKQFPRNRLTDESVRSPSVAKASYEGQSEEEMFGLREGTLPDSLNICRMTRDAAEWMATDAPAFTEMSFSRGLPSKEYKNAVVDKLRREKLQGIPRAYIRRLGSNTPHYDWSFESGYMYNKEEYEAAKVGAAARVQVPGCGSCFD